ncbi:hypothetical protein [Deinococcus hohokamensis]|uniref:Uncharacterized protein n=1 Tax=Deinococcus hohokamensis TaxID=309883 RepID=A0ABV9IEU4_9DEIO
MSFSRFLLPLALLLGSAAQAASVTLLPGQTARLGSQTLTVLSVRDSRCPMNARCVRAGELRATVLSRVEGRVRLLRLSFPQETSSVPGGLRISGAPARMAGDRRPVAVTFTDDGR